MCPAGTIYKLNGCQAFKLAHVPLQLIWFNWGKVEGWDLQRRNRMLQARPWSLLLRSWYAGLESTLGAFICAETGWNELSRVVYNYSTCRKVAFERPISKHIQRFFLVCVGPSFLICWLEVKKKWSLSLKMPTGLLFYDVTFFFSFPLILPMFFFLNYPLWTKHRG